MSDRLISGWLKLRRWGRHAFDEMDYWNILSFSISPPGTITTGDDDATLETRTISVGDYDTLLVIEESESQEGS